MTETHCLGKIDDRAIVGAFEELPVILVVLVAVSLFSVSVAHAALAWGENDAREALRQDCQAFALLVRYSDTLSGECGSGIYDADVLLNLSSNALSDEFNSSLLGFEYSVTVQCIDLQSGNITSDCRIFSSDKPDDTEVASTNTCICVDNGGNIGTARLTVSIWRPLA